MPRSITDPAAAQHAQPRTTRTRRAIDHVRHAASPAGQPV
jgi:hypothetical protein